MFADESPCLIKGRFIIQEVQEKRTERNSRHESISSSKKVFIKTVYTPKALCPKSSDKENYSSLVFDCISKEWIDFDSMWNRQSLKSTDDCSFRKIFHYLNGDTEDDSSHLKSSKDMGATSGKLKENFMKKPKSQSYLDNSQTVGVTFLSCKDKGDELSCVSTEEIHYDGAISEEKLLRRRMRLLICNQMRFTIGVH